MPIKPENKALYPKNWEQISEQVKLEQNYKCKNCSCRHHAVGYRDKDGLFNKAYGNLIMDDYGNGIDYRTGKITEYKKAKETADWLTDNDEMGDKYIVIVLTTAHLDHDPTNNKRTNLAALCQKCHNTYDMPHRIQTRKQNKYKGMKSLF